MQGNAFLLLPPPRAVSKAGEAGFGVAEAIELHSHAVHD